MKPIIEDKTACRSGAVLKEIFNSAEWRGLSIFLSIQETADFLNISRETVRSEINAGNLSAVIKKVNSKSKRKSYLILKTSLQNYLMRRVN